MILLSTQKISNLNFLSRFNEDNLRKTSSHGQKVKDFATEICKINTTCSHAPPWSWEESNLLEGWTPVIGATRQQRSVVISVFVWKETHHEWFPTTINIVAVLLKLWFLSSPSLLECTEPVLAALNNNQMWPGRVKQLSNDSPMDLFWCCKISNSHHTPPDH